MKAIVAYGSKKVEFETNRARPTLKPGEVLVRVRASPIQPSDLLNISGNFPNTAFPIVPGRDYAGLVVEPASSPWHGTSVYGTSGTDLSITRDGAHAEFVVLPEDSLAAAPKNLDSLQASLVGTPWTTAWLALHRADAKKGETVLVIGAGGKVGSAVVELAKSNLWGCRVLTAGRGDKYDVDVGLHPDMSTVKEKNGGRGPNVVVDATGDLRLAHAGLRVASKRGRLCIISTASSKGTTDNSVSIDFKELYRMEHVMIGCNSFEHSMQEMAGFLLQMASGFESGELSAPNPSGPRIKKIGLEGVKNAYEQMANGSKDVFLIEMGRSLQWLRKV